MIVHTQHTMHTLVDDERTMKEGNKNKKLVWPCDQCGVSKSKAKACGLCQVAYYCSKDCQTQAWPSHKMTCKTGQAKKSPYWYFTKWHKCLGQWNNGITFSINLGSAHIGNSPSGINNLTHWGKWYCILNTLGQSPYWYLTQWHK